MRIGGMVWFAAGFAFCLLYLNDGIGGLIGASPRSSEVR
jgi:hypothetical protein